MDGDYSPSAAEAYLRALWENSGIFKFDENSKKQVFSIDTPPPTISGELHMGHMFSYSHADFIARYKRMRGYNVFYPFGIDNNGLPTELLIEKKFNTTAEALGRDKFVKLVQDNISEYVNAYISIMKMLGLSVDWSKTYETISDDVQKRSQLSFLKLIELGRIYRNEEPVLFCPKCKTVISQMELEDKQIESKIYTLNFGDLKIATTRPELLPACVAVLVNPEDSRYSSLIGKTIKVPLFDSKVKIIGDQNVEKDFGTGAVMCCTFGDATDVEWYKKYNLDLKIIIDETGHMSNDYFKGLTIKEARGKIVEDLKAKGIIIDEKPITHNVNVHERCGTEVEFISKKQWKVRYLDLKDKFIELGREVNWHPEFMRVRYENWVNGLKWDWNISRQRMFGVKFPVWYCKKCGKPKFAHIEDLPVDPFVDKPREPCECGSDEFIPETDVMDTWATSSLTPLINAKWGEEKNYMNIIYPMSMRPQAHEIISFWAFTTIVKSYFHTGTIPWHDIVLSGHGLDPHGRPIHKSWGNVIKPEPYFEKFGADAIRYWASGAMLGDDISFQEKDITAATRLIKKMWNLGKFISQHLTSECNFDSIEYTDELEIARLNTMLAEVTTNFENFDYFRARMRAEEFFWEFANDYIEIVKHRIYGNDLSAICTAAKVFLYTLKALAPIIPFATDYIYQELYLKNKGLLHGLEEPAISIHVSKWPEYESKQNEKSINSWKSLLEVVHFARKWKHENGMPLNGELSSIVIDEKLKGELEKSVDDIKGALKAKEVSFGPTEGLPCKLQK
ncbi:MAG: valine--tRNA ligase [Candidatus Micrarchaeia archaeon]